MPKLVHDELRCGECGGVSFHLHHESTKAERVGGQGSGGFEGCIVATCCLCKRRSKILVVPAQLTTSGPLCGGWG